MPKLDEQISTLQLRLQQLKLRQQRVDARQRALDATRERKADLRRQILLGALVMEKMRQGELDQRQILAWLDPTLARPSDRSLFDLPIRPAVSSMPATAASAAPGSPADETQLPPRLEDHHRDGVA